MATNVDMRKHWRCMLLASVMVSLPYGCTTADDSLRQVRVWASGGWVATYELAERQAEHTGRPMALYFKGGRQAITDPVYEALQSPTIKSRLNGYVRGTLVKELEPDRRYAAQFDVERAPALILVHADGTYHALTGILNTETLAGFIDQAEPPGANPTYNSLIPRGHRYQWLHDVETARSRSAQLEKPMVVVYARRLTSEWRRLNRMLDTREVWVRVAGLVHCRRLLLPGIGNTVKSPYGTIQVPAIVVEHPDGAYSVLELPTSSEAIARFVDAGLSGDTGDSPSARASAQSGAALP